MSYLLRMEQNAGQFTPADRQIADYFAANPEVAVLLTAKELGEASGSSAAAVIRFLKKLGYDSLTQLRVEISKEAQTPPAVPAIPFQPDDPPEMLARKLDALAVGALEKTQGILNLAVFSQTAARLRESRTIHLFGTGASGLVAADLYQKLVRIGCDCRFSPDTHLQLAGAVHLNVGDAALFFSYSGKTGEIVAAARQARANGAFCVGITQLFPSPLSRCLDVVLPLPHVEEELRLGALSSRYAALFLSDLLFMHIAQADFERIEYSLLRSRAMIGEAARDTLASYGN